MSDRVTRESRKIDILRQIHGADAWFDIAAANRAMCHATGDEERMDIEEEAGGTVDGLFRDSDIYGSRATVIGLARTSDDATLHLVAAEGSYEPTTTIPLWVKEMAGYTGGGNDALSLCIDTDPGDGSGELLFFPLDPRMILHASVERRIRDGDIVTLLQREAERYRQLAQLSEEKVAPEERRKTIQQLHENAQDHLDALQELFDGHSFEFEVQSYRSAPDDVLEAGWGSPLVSKEGNNDVDARYIVADSARMYDPEVDGPLSDDGDVDDMRVILNVDMTGMAYLVRVHDITNCTPIPDDE